MSFRDEMISSIKTPQEAEDNKKNSVINQCKYEAQGVFENIKYLLKEAANKGEYETYDGYRVIKINPRIVDEYSCGTFHNKDIKCN